MSNTSPSLISPEKFDNDNDNEMEFHVSYHEYYKKDLKPENDNNINFKYEKLLKDYYELKRENTEFRDLNKTLLQELEEKKEKIKKLENKYSNKKVELEREKEFNYNVLIEYEQNVKEKDNKIKNYEIKINSLYEQIFQFQNDDNINYNFKFTKDIENIQIMLENYVGNLKSSVEINLVEINKLLLSYGCKAQVKSKENNYDSLLIKCVLQRLVIDGIIHDVNYYFEKHSSITFLESDIYESTNYLLNLLNLFSTTRDGANELTKFYLIKIRQQIYELLGSFGFSDVIINENKQDHIIISIIKERLNNSINKLHMIKDPEKSRRRDDIATNLIREVIKIFFFRSKAQEPIAECLWFPYNSKIDPNLTEDKWNNDNNKSFVELCYFPLLATNNKIKVYTRAKVVQQDFETNNFVWDN